MAEPPYTEIRSLIEKLESRSYSTYKARVLAFSRLTRLSNWWNASLIAFSTSTTIAAVGLLVEKNMYGRGGEALMVALAILSLVASLVAASVNYSGRAKAMESSYKEIQQISVRAEALKACEGPDLWSSYLELQREYANTIMFSENHKDVDHRRMTESKPGKLFQVRQRASTLVPALTFALPVALFVPFAMWLQGQP